MIGCVNMLFPQNEFLSWRIADYLISCGYFDNCDGDFYSAIEWLNLCSGLETVNIVPNKYDEGLLYCGSAWDYEVSKSNISSELSTKLVRFHFAWGSLESMITALIPMEKVERYGKVNALCGYLKLNNLSDLLPYYYLDEYCHLISLMRNVKQYQKDLEALDMLTETKYSYEQHVDSAGIGIYTVYKIRNKFAHGALHFPEPEEYGGEQVFDVEIIDIATRIVLMTILTLLINDTKDNDFSLNDLIYDTNNQYAVEYLRSLCKTSC